MRASRFTPGTPTRERFARLLCAFAAGLAPAVLSVSPAGAATPPPLMTPKFHTQASPSVSVGGSISDAASLVGAPLGPKPSGTVVFKLYGPDDVACARPPIFTSPAITARLTVNSGAFKPTAPGTYRWVGAYSGDANYAPALGKCSDPNEAVLVTVVTPTLTTTASPSVAVGGSVTDSAVLAGGMNPTGSIVFVLYQPIDTTCAGPPVFRSAVPISASIVSDPYTPPIPGTFRWVAFYAGDASNGAVHTACNDPGESVVVTPGPGAPGGPPGTPPGSGTGSPPPACDVVGTARAVLAGLAATLTGKPGAGFRSTCSAGLRIVLRAKEIRPGNPGQPRGDGFTTMANVLTHISPNGPALAFSLNQNGRTLRDYALSHGRRLIAFLIVHVRPDKSSVSTESLQILTLG